MSEITQASKIADVSDSYRGNADAHRAPAGSPTGSDTYIVQNLVQQGTNWILSRDNFASIAGMSAIRVDQQKKKLPGWKREDVLRPEVIDMVNGGEPKFFGTGTESIEIESRVRQSGDFIEEWDRQNADPWTNLRETKANIAVQRLLIDQEVRFKDAFMVTGKFTAGTRTGTAWTADDSDPINDVEVWKGQISITGVDANTIICGWNTYRVLRRHPVVLEAMGLGGGATPNDSVFRASLRKLAEAFDVERFIVSNVGYNSAVPGADENLTRVLNNEFLVCHTPGPVYPGGAVTAGYKTIFTLDGVSEVGLRSVPLQNGMVPGREYVNYELCTGFGVAFSEVGRFIANPNA